MQFTIRTLTIDQKKLTYSMLRQLPDGYHRNGKNELLSGIELLGWVTEGKAVVRHLRSDNIGVWAVFAKDGKVYRSHATKEDQAESEQIFV